MYPDYEAARRGEYYTETEIPYGLEKQLGMRGYEYLQHLEDSISANTSIDNDTVSETWIKQQALKSFRERVQAYYDKERR